VLSARPVYDVAKAWTVLLIHVALVLRQSSLSGRSGNISNCYRCTSGQDKPLLTCLVIWLL